MPIIIQTVGQIDVRYNSIRLVKRFKSERLFTYFLGSLIFAIIMLIYNKTVLIQWKHDWGHLDNIMSESSNILTLASTIVLIYLLFKITWLIICYYDYQKLYWRIRNNINIENGIIEKDGRDIAELGKFILLKDDNNTSANFYQLLYEYSIEKSNDKVFEVVEYDDWFYDVILSINETLCREKILSISIVNGNDLLKIFIPENPESIISDKTYMVLWRTLQQQLYYEKNNMVLEYWEFAHQYSLLRLRPMKAESVIESEPLTINNKTYSQKRDEQIIRFKEFHVALCSFILYSKKYELLQKILNYSSTEPYQFPLVPSSFQDITQQFINLKIVEAYPSLYYLKNYPFRGEKGVDAGNITLSWCYKYLSLLLVRLNSFEVSNMSSWKNPWEKPKTPSSLQETTELLLIVEQIKYYVEAWRKKDGFQMIGYLGWDVKNDDLDLVITKLDKYINDLKETIIHKRESIAPSPDKIMQFNDRSLELIRNTVNTYQNILPKCSVSDRKLIKDVINSSYSMPIDKEAFSDDQTKHFVNFDEVVATNVVREFYHLYSLSFYKNTKRFITIDSENLFQALDKLIGEKSNQYVVICFGLYLDYYLKKPNSQIIRNVEQSRNYSKFTFKQKIIIHSLPSGDNSLMDNNVVIINKDDLPCYEHQVPPKATIEKFNLKQIDDTLSLYSSIQCDDIQQVHVEFDAKKNCLATIYYCLILYWKKSADVTNLRIISKYVDSGMGEVISNLSEL